MKKFFRDKNYPSFRLYERGVTDLGFIDLNISIQGNIDFELRNGKNVKDSGIIMFAFQYFKETFKDDEFYKLRLKK